MNRKTQQSFDYGPHTRTGGVPADVAAAELARIREENKRLTASAVVAAAEPDDAPLHAAFEWDDTVAAREHRLSQARMLIRAVRIVRADQPPQRIYVHIPDRDEEGAYEPIALVVKQPDQFALALMELRRRLSSAQEALDELRAAGATGGDRDRMAMITLATEAFAAASSAIQALS